jgi:hypothetical protein
MFPTPRAAVSYMIHHGPLSHRESQGRGKVEVQGEVDRQKTAFNPLIVTAFKDVTSQTSKDHKFRRLLESRLGPQAIERVFREYDAAPEQPREDPPPPPPNP